MQQFAYISFVPEKKSVMRRLGAQKARFAPALAGDVDALLEKAQSAFRAAGKAAVLPVVHAGAGLVQIGGHDIESAQLARLLGSSAQAYLMCASLRRGDVEKIGAAMREGEGLKALVLDAYASEYVDGALGVIMEQKNQALRRTGQRLTRHRFSAGYGDLDIKYQKLFYDLLDMRTLDVTINDKYLLSPEKSVIAVAGVE